jgi:hypothetical protein
MLFERNSEEIMVMKISFHLPLAKKYQNSFPFAQKGAKEMFTNILKFGNDLELSKLHKLVDVKHLNETVSASQIYTVRRYSDSDCSDDCLFLADTLLNQLTPGGSFLNKLNVHKVLLTIFRIAVDAYVPTLISDPEGIQNFLIQMKGNI